ncbi:DUF4408 domain-containing protein [Cephalotus follicularis]|uniref:DUF4408 domain-containing protein n=1 Tax=Cephalotus follicularis TaxID=3775 RepID=A0A1Q3AR87_CEPFO|nr:DUF4408 domain-containing protein [Cephalotus follicularis]
MDTFQVNYIRFVKANAVLKNRQLQNIANLCRLVGLCVVLVLISRFTAKVPVAVKNSGGYFKDLSIILVSPRFVFIVGNVIIITLFAKSGQFSALTSTTRNSKNDIYEEFVRKSKKSQNISIYEVENREKQNISEEKMVADGNWTSMEAKDYRRTKSENFKRVDCDKSSQILRRLGTENYKKVTDSGDKLVKNSYPKDHMSSEEFRDTIEAFIERQKRKCWTVRRLCLV